MAKEEKFVLTGEVVEVLGGGKYKVSVDELGVEIIAYPSWKMKKHNIRILEGDKVDVEVSPYDPSQGRIIFRHKYTSNESKSIS